MFAKFKLEPIKVDSNRLYDIGKTLYEKNMSATRSCLDDYINMNSSLSVEKIEEDWFPQINADIFLSHAHADEKTIIALAGW